MSSIKSFSPPDTVAAAIAAGANAVTAIREAMGYSIEDLAVTCGLAVDELTDMESGDIADDDKLRRIASALGFPETFVTGP